MTAPKPSDKCEAFVGYAGGHGPTLARCGKPATTTRLDAGFEAFVCDEHAAPKPSEPDSAGLYHKPVHKEEVVSRPAKSSRVTKPSERDREIAKRVAAEVGWNPSRLIDQDYAEVLARRAREEEREEWKRSYATAREEGRREGRTEAAYEASIAHQQGEAEGHARGVLEGLRRAMERIGAAFEHDTEHQMMTKDFALALLLQDIIAACPDCDEEGWKQYDHPALSRGKVECRHGG